jgi:hypothetical protein
MLEPIFVSESVQARRRSYFHAVTGSNGLTPMTGLTGRVFYSKLGGTPTSSLNAVTEIGAASMPGRYYIDWTATEANTIGSLQYRFAGTGSAEVIGDVKIVAFDPWNSQSGAPEVWAATTRTLTNLDTSSIWTAPTRTLTNLDTSSIWTAPVRVLTSASVDATATALAVLDAADTIETGLTLRGALRVTTAVAAGKISGADTATIYIRNIGDTKTRVTSSVDITGRTSVTVDVT